MHPTEEGTFEGLRWKRYGTGPAMLLLHGFCATSYTWRYLVPELAKNHSVWTIDLKGHGDSAAPRDDHYALADQALIIQRLIERFDLKNIDLVGNSMGGGIALLLAMRLESSGRVASLTIIDGIAYPQPLPWPLHLIRTPLIGSIVMRFLPPRVSVKKVFETVVYDKRSIVPDAVDAYAHNLRTTGGRYAMRKTAQQIIPRDLGSILKNIPRLSIPTLIIWGKSDRIVPLAIGERLHREIRGSELVVFEKCGHIPQEEKPHESLLQIQAFLQKQNRAA